MIVTPTSGKSLYLPIPRASAEEVDDYDRRYSDGMTHEEGFDFARSWHSMLDEASKEIVRLRAEIDASGRDDSRARGS